MTQKSTKKHWEDYWSSHDHQGIVVHKELIDNIIKVINVNGKKTLEIGGGMAGDSFELAKKGADVYILDYSKKALEEVEKYAKKVKIKIHPIEADAYKLPFKDETFDLIFHQGFLEHFRDPLNLLFEQYRVLKKGGIIVVDVPQKFTTYTLKKQLAIRRGTWFAGWETQFSVKELEGLLRRAGFKPIRAYGWGYYGKLHTIRNLPLGKWYENLWRKIENSRIKLYLCWCIGVIAKK